MQHYDMLLTYELCNKQQVMSQDNLYLLYHTVKKKGCFDSICNWLPQFPSSYFCIIKYSGVSLSALHSKQWLDFPEH